MNSRMNSKELYRFLDISVVIPTFNGKSRQLTDIILALEQQSNVNMLAWEIIVVNNNSNDGTAEWVQKRQDTWNHPFPLRLLTENTQGVAYARQNGVIHAAGEFIAFLDDDNVPEKDWLYEAWYFGHTHPKAGVWAGKCKGVYEETPGPEFHRVKSLLAIIDRGEKEFIYGNIFPPGPGLTLRKSIYMSCYTTVLSPGRLSTCNVTCEDMMVSLYIQKNGWQIWYNPRMVIYHHLPKHRFEPKHILWCMEGMGIGRFLIRLHRYNVCFWPCVIIAYWLKDSYQLTRFLIKDYLPLRHDLFVQCELKMRWGLWISPWYFLKKKIYSWIKK